MAATAAASQMPLRLASFYASTWDYTLYSEGFLAPFSADKGFKNPYYGSEMLECGSVKETLK